MEQNPSSPASRERAVSSEPASTRLNPFDESDLLARKRRRTSVSESSSKSVDLASSHNHALNGSTEVSATADSIAAVMTVDPSEAAAPSTPPASEDTPLPEPVSSKVTINLRTSLQQNKTPDSPTSPSRSKVRTSAQRPSSSGLPEGLEPFVLESSSADTSIAGSPDVPIVILDEDEDVEDMAESTQTVRRSSSADSAALASALANFPYFTPPEDTIYDTFVRLHQYLHQGTPEPDEILRSLLSWVNDILPLAGAETLDVLSAACQEQSSFWLNVPELFLTIFRKYSPSRSRETTRIVHELSLAYAQLAARLLAMDCHILDRINVVDGNAELELFSPNFLLKLAFMAHKNDQYNLPGHDPDTWALLSAFRPDPTLGTGIEMISRFPGLLLSLLPKSPRKTIEYLVKSSALVEALVQACFQKRLVYGSEDQGVIQDCQRDMSLALKYFNLAWNMTTVAAEKFTTHLPVDSPSNLLAWLCEIFKIALSCEIPEVQDTLQGYAATHPSIDSRFLPEAITLECKFKMLDKLVRSQQMQLRVSAVGAMCSELVGQWRRCQEQGQGSAGGEYGAYIEFLRYFSAYLLQTGAIDYFLGPSCHPEIIVESANIVGFLMVTKTYTYAQTDLLWNTVTSTRDPRISDALIRMLLKIPQLCESDTIAYLFQKLQDLPTEAFSSTMRELFDALIRQVFKIPQAQVEPVPSAPRQLCLRLIQQSSMLAANGALAHHDIFVWAQSKIKDLTIHPTATTARQELLSACLQDISAKSPTTHGSLQVLSLLTNAGATFQSLVTEHGIIPLLVDELAATMTNARLVGFSPVYATPFGSARRRFISIILTQHASMIPKDVGYKLWNLLVGTEAICNEDVKAAWDDLNSALRRTRHHNEFLKACLEDYLPQLPAQCYCAGSLEFVREVLLNEVIDTNSTLFDEKRMSKVTSLEILWQMVLTGQDLAIVDQAIHTLVVEVYVGSPTIKAFPLDRARKVHFLLAERCLRQLKAAAQTLQDLKATTSDYDEDFAKREIEKKLQEQKLRFARSLRVVKDLLRALKDQSHFSAPDLRSLILQPPSAVDGELASLKYQAFDNEDQTDIMPLNIGVRNTGASLLASLREATGFDNYRLYFRGQPLAPSSGDICKSIQELNITTGLVLVRRESNATSSPARIRPGASPLEIEILRYFKDLWEFLSLEEVELSGEIYQFLITLPADDTILEIFEYPATSHRDVFSIGYPFKSLYAIHALREYINTHNLRNSVVQTSGQDSNQLDDSASSNERAIVKALTLLVSALCDADIIQQSLSEDMNTLLRYHLVNNFLEILKDSPVDLQATYLLSKNLSDMLIRILHDAMQVVPSNRSTELIYKTFEAILESASRSIEFWVAFRDNQQVSALIKGLILEDCRDAVRKGCSKMIVNKSLQPYDPALVPNNDFAAFFWPIIFDLLPAAAEQPPKCEECLHLALRLITKLAEVESSALDLVKCLARCNDMLMAHTPMEDVTDPACFDPVAHGIVMIISQCMKHARTKGMPLPFEQTLARGLFTRHLFPGQDESGPLVPRPIIHPQTRNALYAILSTLNNGKPPQFLLTDLGRLTPLDDNGEYVLDLPFSFDRQKSIRSSCGYAGLRNLSNTCYLNSLMTQLFMNPDFRQFILSARISNLPRQQLLCETQQLFAALQDSLRRFIDPQSCVGQISTYDETPIDIHNQMDVDEFYNLLFDRWEAQMASDISKKQLRSIFGGELVQQVKSKECDHISERFEDFSAIQCDIKGKASLEESLQAYVDGEIMEGENKYKCSSCDRFVDAVKRACFKSLPSNLIFHLKRFDFNLRTLTRAKINDHFRFPMRIDMTPYTVHHLANPSNDPDPDIFELVGILVHSGSAESGHYYSYTRERTAENISDKWVEFNDDFVTTWDPSMMQNACFGGQESHPPFDGGPHEKVYSAYMLFYQRASSQNEAQRLTPSATAPLRCPLPSALEPVIRDENAQIVHRHCLHDPNHVSFVITQLNNIWKPACSSRNHTIENLAMHVALGHLDQVASRAKDIPDFPTLVALIQQTIQRCPKCALAFFDYLSTQPEALVMLLQRNPNPAVRHETGRTFLMALKSLKKHFPEAYGDRMGDDDSDLPLTPDNIIAQAIALFQRLWEQFHVSLRSWPEVFGTMLEFARLGQLEATALLQANFLVNIAAIITVEVTSEMSVQYSRLATTLSRRLASRPPNYENIISLIDVLLSVIDPEIDTDRIVEVDENRFIMAFEYETVPFTSQEVNLLHQEWGRGRSNVFIDKLIQVNQNPPATEAILKRLIDLSEMMDHAVYSTLRIGITGQIVHYLVGPYLRAACVYCHFSENTLKVQRLHAHINEQCSMVQNAEARSFFDFYLQMHTRARDGDDKARSVLGFTKWAPYLLAHIDHTVSRDVSEFLHDALLQYGPSASFSEAEGGAKRSKVMDEAARRLCLACLIYLRDNYVARGVPVARDTVLPLLQVVQDCQEYFGETDSTPDVQYQELCQAVIDPISALTVDEIDEDGSDWENSVGSSEPMDSLADINMQIGAED